MLHLTASQLVWRLVLIAHFRCFDGQLGLDSTMAIVCRDQGGICFRTGRPILFSRKTRNARS